MRRVSCVEYQAELVDGRLVFTETRRWTEPAENWTEDFRPRNAPIWISSIAKLKQLARENRKPNDDRECRENHAG